MAASCIKNALDVVWFMDWVVQVYFFKPVGNDVLDVGVETLEEGTVELINGNLMVHKEGGGNRQETPVVFQNISFIMDVGLS